LLLTPNVQTTQAEGLRVVGGIRGEPEQPESAAIASEENTEEAAKLEEPSKVDES
jgi:hypothetical protein